MNDLDMRIQNVANNFNAINIEKFMTPINCGFNLYSKLDKALRVKIEYDYNKEANIMVLKNMTFYYPAKKKIAKMNPKFQFEYDCMAEDIRNCAFELVKSIWKGI